MATLSAQLTDDAYTEISDAACSFQVQGNQDIRIAEKTTEPDKDTGNFKEASPGKMYVFEPGAETGEKLWGLATSSNATVGYELV